MADVIDRYSPNTEYGQQKVEVVVMAWDYSATFDLDISTNCTGFDVLETAVDYLYEELPENEDGVKTIELRRPDGGTLTCDDDLDGNYHWLKAMIVSIRIVSWTPPTLNEIRAINGEPPVPDGDCPWDPD